MSAFSPLPLRRRPSLWLATVPLALIGLYYLTSHREFSTPGYWTGVASSATIYIVFACGYGAVAAAVEGSRLRRAKVTRLASVRGPVIQLVDSCWLPFGVAVLLQGLGLSLTAIGTWGAPGAPPIALLWAWIAMIGLHTAAGYFMGRVFPVVVAVPVSLLASFAWLGFAWTTDFFPLRYLAGLVLSQCCTADSTVEPQAFVSVITFSTALTAGLIVAVLSLTAEARRWSVSLSMVLATAIAVAGTSLSLSAASDLGPYPGTARDAAEYVCEGDQPTICVYPEQVWGNDNRPVIREAINNLEAAGIATPETVVTGPSLPDDDRSTARVVLRSDMTDDVVQYSVVSTYLPDSFAATCPEDTDPLARRRAADLVLRYLYSQVTDLPLNYSPVAPEPDYDPEAEMRKLGALAPDDQNGWLEAARAAARSCTAPVPTY